MKIKPALTTLNQTEFEVIGLCICIEALGDIANHALLEIQDVLDTPDQAQVYFHSSIHKELFLIRLLDFVQEKTDSSLTNTKGSCLDILKQVCKTQSFNNNGSIAMLQTSIVELDNWINHKTPLTLWLPTLDIDANISVSRSEFLYICANHSKHNLSRLTAVSKTIQKILESHGYAVPLELIPLALDDFREHLQENYFAYYGTWLTELVNNIRWGLQDYLTPIFYRSFERVEDHEYAYRYTYPTEVINEIPKKWFWRLMNNIRTSPYLKRFTASEYLKRMSSLE